MAKIPAGTIGWMDLTVPNAEKVRDFYATVAGWKPAPVEMGGYSDYTMSPPGSKKPVAGVCHKRGVNAALPSSWIIYIIVPNLTTSLRKCRKLGGKVLVGPKSMGASRYAVIRDPAGAVCGLYQSA